MPAKHSRDIGLTETLASRDDAQFARGENASAGDLVRTAVRVLRPRDAGRRAPRPTPSARAPSGMGRV